MFHVDPGSPVAVTTGRAPLEAEGVELDGVPIAILLHVVDGRATELEIYRVDGQSIQCDSVPAAQTITINGPAIGGAT